VVGGKGQGDREACKKRGTERAWIGCDESNKKGGPNKNVLNYTAGEGEQGVAKKEAGVGPPGNETQGEVQCEEEKEPFRWRGAPGRVSLFKLSAKVDSRKKNWWGGGKGGTGVKTVQKQKGPGTKVLTQN